MHEIPTYDHSKPDTDEQDKPTFYHRAAKVTLWAAIVGGIFLRAVAYSFKDIKGPWLVIGSLGVTGAALLLYGSCIILGITAICGIRKHGSHGILLQALGGITISVIVLGLLGTGFVRGYQMALKKRKEMQVRALTPETRTEAKNGTAGTEPPAPAATNPKSTKATKESIADTTPVGKAERNYEERLQSLVVVYTATAAALKTPSVLNMSDVERREQLQARKEAVNKFMEANEKLMAFITRGEANFKNELVRGAQGAAADAAVKTYRRTAAERNYLLVKIRGTDQKIGTALLGMLNALQSSWGNWKYDAEKKGVTFQDATTLDKYNENLKGMNAATAEQAQLQTQLAHPPEAAVLE